MVKLITSLGLCCYLLVTTGVVAISHYCMDRIAAVSLFVSTGQKCSQCGSSKTTDGCCKDKETLLKLDTSHNTVTAFVYKPLAFEHLPVLTTEFLRSTLYNSVVLMDDRDRPPPLSGPGIYLRNRVFRI